MAYFREVRNAAVWLQQQRNDDGGWGMVPGQASSMVNTAEALFVLAKAGCDSPHCSDGLAFLRENLKGHLKTRGPRIRYVAFPLMTIEACFPSFDARLRHFLADWLIAAKNSDDGWGETARNEQSDIFSTYLAVEALRDASGPVQPHIKSAGAWVLARVQGSGWKMHEGQVYSPTATAYALSVLRAAGMADTHAFQVGRELLLTNKTWENEEVVISGTKWLHSRGSAVIRALVASEEDVLLPVVADAVRAFQRCVTPDKGWTEQPGENTPTIRSQYWATLAMEPLCKCIDPALTLTRIDALYQQGLLTEPAYVPVLTKTKLHTIIPAPLFRAIVWTGVVGGFALSLGVAAVLPSLPMQAAAIVGLGILALSLWVMTKRPTQFPRVGRWVRRLTILVGAAGAVFGVSPLNVADWLRSVWRFFGAGTG